MKILVLIMLVSAIATMAHHNGPLAVQPTETSTA